MRKKISVLLGVVFGCVAFISLGIKLMSPDENVYVYDSTNGVKYKVSAENYSKHIKEEEKRF